MTQPMTVKDSLGIDNFDPLAIDISEFQYLYNAIPADGNIDINIAPSLAAQFLRAADRCSEILAAITWHVQRSADTKKRAFSHAFLLAKEAGSKTDTAAKHKAECDQDYIDACDRFAEAEAVKLHFKTKHEAFLKGHHLMKDILRGEQNHQNASGFSETIGHNSDWGEKKW